IEIDLAGGGDGTFSDFAPGPFAFRFRSEVSQLGRSSSGSGAQDTSLLPDRMASHQPDTASGDDPRSHNHGGSGLVSTQRFAVLRQSSPSHRAKVAGKSSRMEGDYQRTKNQTGERNRQGANYRSRKRSEVAGGGQTTSEGHPHHHPRYRATPGGGLSHPN